MGNMGPRDPSRPEETANVAAMTIDTPPISVRQCGGPHDHPFHLTGCNRLLLPGLVPKIKRQYHRNHKERVIKAHATDTVPDAERSLADETPHSMSLHRTQEIARAFR